MRKRYIFWWVISAILFWNFVSSLFYGEGLTGANGVLLVLAGLAFFVGFLRHREYEQQREDREALHRFVDHATAEQPVPEPPKSYSGSFEDCVQLALDRGEISVSQIQRNLKVGYTQAARWMDRMDELGIVGPYDGSRPRRVLYTPEDFPGVEALEATAVPKWQPSPAEYLELDVVGETFRNDDGSSRQELLRQAEAEGCCGETELERYDFRGKPAVRVLYDGGCIGNIGRKDLNRVLPLLDRVLDVQLFVDSFEPEDDHADRDEDPARSYTGSEIYYAKLRLKLKS